MLIIVVSRDSLTDISEDYGTLDNDQSEESSHDSHQSEFVHAHFSKTSSSSLYCNWSLWVEFEFFVTRHCYRSGWLVDLLKGIDDDEGSGSLGESWDLVPLGLDWKK